MKVTNKLYSMISSLDLFGRRIELNINSSNSSNTFLGGILSINMIFLLLLFLYYNSLDVINRQNPQITIEQQINTNKSDIILDKYTFPISFAMTDVSNKNILRPEYFMFNLAYINDEDSYTIYDLSLNITKCTRNHFPRIEERIFYNQKLDTNFCIDNQNITIYGSWSWISSPNYLKALKISVSICSGKKECAPFEEIKNFINSNELYWNLFYQSTTINQKNTHQPFYYSIINYYRALKFDTKKTSEIFLRKQVLNSEEGFILPNMKTYESTSYDSVWTDSGAVDKTNTLVEFSIVSSQNTLVYNRNFKKVQEAIADTGGLVSVFEKCCVVFCYIFSTIKRDEIILNNIFDFEIDHAKKNYLSKTWNGKTDNLHLESQPKDVSFNDTEKPKIYFNDNLNISNKAIEIDNKKINSLPIPKTYLNSENSLFKCKNKSKDEESEKVLKTLRALENNKKSHQLKFSFIEIICAFILCESCQSIDIKNKKKLYKKSKFAINQFLDISFIIKKLEEFEKLKIVLLNPEQIALFDFISREIISLDNERILNHDMTRMKNFDRNKETLAKVMINYKKNFNKILKEPGETDKKLIVLLDEDLK